MMKLGQEKDQIRFKQELNRNTHVTERPPPGRRVPRRNSSTGEGGRAPWRPVQDRILGRPPGRIWDSGGHGGSGDSGGHGGAGDSGGHGEAGSLDGHGGLGSLDGHGG